MKIQVARYMSIHFLIISLIFVRAIVAISYDTTKDAGYNLGWGISHRRGCDTVLEKSSGEAHEVATKDTVNHLSNLSSKSVEKVNTKSMSKKTDDDKELDVKLMDLSSRSGFSFAYPIWPALM
eukprot:CAMPEP_0197827538 /NCGR_PEP_ID=MMETSP1437-20131217/4283_1 /TAXON_ID=49252 ORGANISM="Eucampia antarctica, Strain CCMP1452" /NCGR_SAMPLE_ID=MMETSP1437 /ASSEMBLY_ACC=CAM_ASM_001096 /LENGTH=122 /DNA_ID=CAMNT_0043428403 /DNA_START=15 /DNA_END=383 /DNA_ORIENTATION=+